MELDAFMRELQDLRDSLESEESIELRVRTFTHSDDVTQYWILTRE